MQINDIFQLYEQHPEVEALVSVLKKKKGENRLLARDCCGSLPALVLGVLSRKLHRDIVYILENQEEAAYVQHDLAVILGDDQAAKGACRSYLFPTTHRIRQKGSDESYTIQRTEVLARLKSGEQAEREPIIITTYPDALMEEVASQEELMTNSLVLNCGQTMSEVALGKQLIELGFERVDFVYEPGQYAIRGGIVDIYSPAQEQPIRAEFFGDELDTMGYFDPQTQRRNENIESVTTNDTTTFFDTNKNNAKILEHTDKSDIGARIDEIQSITHTDTVEIEKHGNMGVTSTQNMLMQEYELRRKNIIYEYLHQLANNLYAYIGGVE